MPKKNTCKNYANFKGGGDAQGTVFELTPRSNKNRTVRSLGFLMRRLSGRAKPSPYDRAKRRCQSDAVGACSLRVGSQMGARLPRSVRSPACIAATLPIKA